MSIEASRTHRLVEALRRESPWDLALGHCEVVWMLTHGDGGVLSARTSRPTTRYMRPYLAQSFDHTMRREILVGQTRYLSHHVNRRFYEQLAAGAVLWRHNSSGVAYSIGLLANEGIHGEGDFRLVFESDRVPIFELSFSLGPPLPDRSVGIALLVVRVQGARGQLDAIRRASKDLCDISPAALLVSAAEGVALALSIVRLCGIADCEQLSRYDIAKTGCHFDYDRFWESLSGERRGFWYHFDVPRSRKPLALVASAHRRRAKLRRRFRDVLRDLVRASFRARFSKEARCPPSL